MPRSELAGADAPDPTQIVIALEAMAVGTALVVFEGEVLGYAQRFELQVEVLDSR